MSDGPINVSDAIRGLDGLVNKAFEGREEKQPGPPGAHSGLRGGGRTPSGGPKTAADKLDDALEELEAGSEEGDEPKKAPQKEDTRAPKEESEEDEEDTKSKAKAKPKKRAGKKDEEGEEGEPEKPVRKFKRWGKDVEIDLSDPMSAVEQLLGMVSDDAEVSTVIDDQEYRFPQHELYRNYQTSAAANRRFYEAKNLVGQYQQLVQSHRQDPAALLRQLQLDPIEDNQVISDVLVALGVEDPIEWASKFAWEEVDLQSKLNKDSANYNPAKYVELEFARKERMAAIKREREQRQQQALAEQQAHAQRQQAFQQHLQAVAGAMPEALTKQGIPVTELTQRISWNIYQDALQSGRAQAGMTPDDIAYETKRWLGDQVKSTYQQTDIRELFGDEPIQAVLTALAQDPDALLDYLGKDVLKAIRQADVRRAKKQTKGAPPGSNYEAAPAAPPNGKPMPGRRMTQKEAEAMVRGYGS